MIITLTCNPAVDQTARVRRLSVGAVHRVFDHQLDPAGKGINVARMARRLGASSVALGFVAGETGAWIERALQREGVEHHFTRIDGETRVNLTVVDDDGTATSFLGPGPVVEADCFDALYRSTMPWLRPGRVLVLAGSLPPGAREDAYAMFVRAGRERNVIVVLDADDEPMRLGVEAGPDLIKPNVAEAERLVGRRLPDWLSLADAARELAEKVATVVISMGARGAICAHGSRLLRAYAPTIEARSSVGVGDAMVAGLAVALERGTGVVEALRLGVAAGTAAAMVPGTAVAKAEQVEDLLSSTYVGELLSESPGEVFA